MQPTDALLLDAEDAARVLGVGRSMIYGLLNAGHLHGVKIGRSRRFSRRELEALVERLEAGEVALPTKAGR